MWVLGRGKVKYTDRYYQHGEFEDHCLVLLCHVERNHSDEQSITKLAEDCGIPYCSLYMILHDAHADKTHSTLYRVALKYGFDFHIYDTWNLSLNHHLREKVIDVVRCDWVNFKYP